MRKIILFPLYIFFKIFTRVYRKNIVAHLLGLSENNSKILDVGCGDGAIGRRMMDINPTLEVEGVDIGEYGEKNQIKKRIFDGNKLPYPDDSFDIVMAIDVLHHTNCIPKLLKEMRRVSKKYVIIKDHKTYGFWSHLLVCFADFITNVPFGIYCAFNYPMWEGWLGYFDVLNLKVDKELKNIKFGFGINDTYNLVSRLIKIK